MAGGARGGCIVGKGGVFLRVREEVGDEGVCCDGCVEEKDGRIPRREGVWFKTVAGARAKVSAKRFCLSASDHDF